VVGKTYFVIPVLARPQAATPQQIAIVNFPSVGARADFRVPAWPGTVKVDNTAPGTVVLVSASSYNGTGTQNPPAIAAGAGIGSFYSSASGDDGIAAVRVPGGRDYFVTCWIPDSRQDQVGYTRVPNTGSNGPYAVSPTQVINASCH
jgi:hypothetical protein